VELSLPEVTSATPGTTNLNVRILGSNNANFTASSRAVFGAGVTVHSTTVESPTSVVATISVADTAALGPRSVGVQAATQTTLLANGFAIVAAPPPPSDNLPPVVSAGTAQVIGSGETATLAGTATACPPAAHCRRRGPSRAARAR
jgi:hypothetical protein